MTYSDKELLEELVRLSELYGRGPTADEMRDSGKYSVEPYKDHFGSWNDALQKCGFDRRSQGAPGGLNGEWVSEDELLEEIRRLYEKFGRSPTANEMREHGSFSVRIYSRRFGSWNEAIETCGYESRLGNEAELHPNWKERQGSSFRWTGPDWDRQSERARLRDGNRCRICGCSGDDDGLPVHHIRPRNVFIEEAGDGYWSVDWDTCDDLSNLITLCRRHHHPSIDGMWEECNHEEFEERYRDKLRKN